MLKITIHDSPSEFRLQLEGRLSGEWVAEVERCWRTGASTIGGRRFVVDLIGVEFADGPGQELLGAMRENRAQFKVSGPLMRNIVSEIEKEKVWKHS